MSEKGERFVETWRQTQIFRARGVTAADFDEDGHLDVFVSNYRLQPNLLWKNDGNCCGVNTYLWSQQLSPDGLTLAGKPVKLTHQIQSWEGALVEAPMMWKQAGKYYLFFSANDYASFNYSVGYATCAGPMGPCTQATENPILISKCRAAGPGGRQPARAAAFP